MYTNLTLTEGLPGTHFQPSYEDYLSEVLIHLCRTRRSWELHPQIPNQVLPSLMHSGKSGETGGVWHFPGADRGLQIGYQMLPLTGLLKTGLSHSQKCFTASVVGSSLGSRFFWLQETTLQVFAGPHFLLVSVELFFKWGWWLALSLVEHRTLSSELKEGGQLFTDM